MQPLRNETRPDNLSQPATSARQIIEDYLHQGGTWLPSAMAKDVIPELRSHLLEQAAQPSGRLTPDAAWNAIVAMGSPDLLAHEFRREATAVESGRIGGGFLNALTPTYRAWLWRTAVVLVIVDILFLAGNTVVALLTPALAAASMLSGIVAQVWMAAGILIIYLALALVSNPQGLPLADIFRGFFERPD